MARKPRQATDAELAVLKALWAGAPLSARSLAEQIYASASSSEIATVQKLISRLEDKGLVKRERRPPAHLFWPTVTQDEFAGEQLEAIAEKVSDGSLTPFLMHLINARGLTKREREDIRKLLDEH